MSPAASKTQAKAAAKQSIVMLADSSGKAKPMKPATEETPAKAKKARTPRTRAAALPKGTDLKAAADELLAAADGKTKAAKKTTKASSTKTKTAKAKTTTAKATAAKSTTAKSTASKAAAKAEAAPADTAKAAVAKPAADKAASAAAEKDARAKALASIKVGPKGVYTEDSIRVYLQEIGRIRLLRPDEEIELARKIADLLLLEELAAQFESDNGREPDTKEWAALVEMPLIKFRRRLMLGRRAKEKMVQSNLRLVVSIAKKYMNRGLSFQDLIQKATSA